MGCFLGCFGSSKDKKRRRQRQKLQPRHQKNVGFTSVESAVSLVKENPENPIISPVSEIRDKSEVQLDSSTRKKLVTFDSNVKAYEHVLAEETTEISDAKEERGKREGEEDNLAKPSLCNSSSVESSITSSSGSYPSNHRYQNCRDSDDELDYEESDIDNNNDDDDDDDDGELDYEDIYEVNGQVESRLRISVDKVVTEEINSSLVTSGLPEREVMLNRSARDRSTYVHPVLNPVENLTQWNALKGKGKPPLKQQKENLRLNEEPQMLFSLEPCFKELYSSFKENSNQSKKSNQEIAVDASLSSWLGSKESVPVNNPSTTSLDIVTPEKGMPLGSSSPSSFDDRPILGALTLEELKQFSASCSPKKSPSRSPDEMPIIGTVGTYWNHNESSKNSGSALSFKGIPNTTSKYSEDKRVNWHSTPFETRLERALHGGVMDTYQTHAPIVS